MKSNLLLLHGALGSKEQFTLLKELLTPAFEVYDLNFSGHGSNTNEVEFSMNAFGEEVLFFLDSKGISSIDIFGYSMGGYVALQLALKHPLHVGKIMTLATKMNWTPESAEKEIKMLIPEVIEAKVPKFAADLHNRHKPNDWKTLMRKTAGMMSALGNGKAILPREFASIKNEVLVCVGDEDKMVSIGESQAVADLLQHAALEIIPGFKHPIETNDPEILSGIISGFFRIT